MVFAVINIGMSRTTTLFAAASAAALTLLGGCMEMNGDSAPQIVGALAVPAAPPILIVRPATSNRPSMMSELTGRLVQIDRCLFVVQDAYRWLMTWPTGTRLRRRADATYQVVVPERSAIPIGAEIVVEGGGSSTAQPHPRSTGLLSQRIAGAPSGLLTSAEFARPVKDEKLARMCVSGTAGRVDRLHLSECPRSIGASGRNRRSRLWS